MAKLTPTDSDYFSALHEGSLNANGPSAWFDLAGANNVSVWGTFTGTITLERSFDGGTTAVPLTQGGQPIAFTAPFSEVIEEFEPGVLYRVVASSWSSGTANFRISR